MTRPVIVGIAGGTGSGKSTVSRRLAEALVGLRVAQIDMDSYYRNFAHLSLDARRQVNWDHPDALDIDLLVEHLRLLTAARAVDKPEYDFVMHLRKPETVRIEPADVIIVDGILLFVEQRVRDLLALKIFVDADADVRLIRRIRRDMRRRGRPLHEILRQYLATVRPMHLRYVEPSRRHADVVAPAGGRSEIVARDIVPRVQALLATP